MFKKPSYFKIFLIAILLLIIKNFLLEYFTQYSINNGDTVNLLIFNVLSTFIDWLVFWMLMPEAKFKYLYILLCTLSNGIPYLISDTIIGIDLENLILKFACAAFPFLVYIIIEKNYRNIIIPIYMGLCAWINMDIANGFTGNISMINLISQLDLLATINVDLLAFAIIKTLFLFASIIIVWELKHQFFTNKSWRFYVEQTMNKKSLFILFIIFKTLIYWLLSSMIIVYLGKNSIQIFSNKLAWAGYGVAFLSILFLYSIYIRKFLTIYFYEKTGINNLAYFLLLLPFVDFIICGILVVFKNFMIQKRFEFKFSPKAIAYVLFACANIYALVCYMVYVQKIPSSETNYYLGSLVGFVIVPLIISVLGYLSIQKLRLFRIYIFFCLIFSLTHFLYIIPNIEQKTDIRVLVGMLNMYFQFVLIIFFFYPLVFFKDYLKIKN